MKSEVKVVNGMAKDYVALLRDQVYAVEPQPIVRVVEIVDEATVMIYLASTQAAVLAGIEALATQDQESLQAAMQKLGTLYESCTNKVYGEISDDLRPQLDLVNAGKINTSIETPTHGWIGKSQFNHTNDESVPAKSGWRMCGA